MRVNANLFKDAVIRCCAIIEKKSLLVFRHILMSIEENRLVMSVTNLDDYFQIVLPAQSDVVMTIALDAPVLEALVKKAKGEVTLTYDPETRKCNAIVGDVSVSIPTVDPTDFPKIPEFDPLLPGMDVQFPDQEQYFRTLKALSPFCTTNENRDYNGILVVQQDDGLHLLSTDTHRLNLAILKNGSTPTAFVLPRSTCDRLVKTFDKVPIVSFRLLGDNSATPETQLFTPLHILMCGESQWMLSRLIKNNFPPHYLQVLDRNRINGRYVEVDRKQFTDKMKSFCDIVKGKYVATTLEYLDGKLFITVNGEDNQSMETELEAAPVGINPDDPCITCINGRYLLQGLKSFSQDKVRISIESGVRPIYLMEEFEGAKRFNMTMPLRGEMKSRRPQPEPQPEEQQETARELAAAA